MLYNVTDFNYAVQKQEQQIKAIANRGGGPKRFKGRK